MNTTAKAPLAARLLLGLPFVVFGLNGFLSFMPMPPVDGKAAVFMGGLAAAGYFFPLLKALEVITGLMLLSGRFVPLALILLAPIVVHIVAYHAFVVGAGMALPLVLASLGIYLAWSYRDAFRGVLTAHAAPTPKAAAPRVTPAAAT